MRRLALVMRSLYFVLCQSSLLKIWLSHQLCKATSFTVVPIWWLKEGLLYFCLLSLVLMNSGKQASSNCDADTAWNNRVISVTFLFYSSHSLHLLLYLCVFLFLPGVFLYWGVSIVYVIYKKGAELAFWFPDWFVPCIKMMSHIVYSASNPYFVTYFQSK